MNTKSKSTLEKYKNILRVKNYSDNTICVYVHYGGIFLKHHNKDIYHISQKEVNYYLMKFSYTSVSQQNQIINSIKTMYLFILGVKLNIQGVERPRKEKRLPQPIDENTLINSINKICNLKHKAIIRLAYSSGMRRSEIINLKIENIDSKRMQIKVIQGKGKKDRIIPLTDGSLKILREYYIQYKPKEYLFNGQNSLKYSGTSLNNIVKKYIGDRYHFHQIRHSCFTHLTDKGIDIRVIQKLAGHSSSKTTEIYTKVSTKNLANLPLF